MTQSYQSLIPEVPRFSLATFPSPLQRAQGLEASLRCDGYSSVPRIYLKRDDLLALAMGGNKTRNLEFLIGDAIQLGAKDVITAGRQQSNHCRLTAAACVKAGLRSHIVVNGLAPGTYTGNLLLDRILGSEILFTGSDDRVRRSALIDKAAHSVKLSGGTPYVIPVGGSDARGALGHVLVAAEVVEQCGCSIGEERVTVVLATATGGTQAGMLAGFAKLDAEAAVIGIAVAKSAKELAGEVLALAGELCAEIGGAAASSGDVLVDGRALGEGYGLPTKEGWQAIERLARSEGVLADPVYTGKGLAGLLSLVGEGRFSPDGAVVFVHTGGGPALFAQGAK